MGINELFEEFIDDREIDIVHSTVETYTNCFKHLSEFYKGVDVKDIDRNMVRKLQKHLLNEKDFSVNYTNKIVGLLKDVMKFAFEQGYTEKNKVSSVGMIRKQVKIKEEKTIWSLKQFKQFEFNIHNERDKIIFNMLFFLGLRKGELLSLKFNEINFDKKTVSILSTAVRNKGGIGITPPKTIHSNRTIVMDNHLCELLQDYYKKLYELYGEVVKDYFIVGDGTKMLSFSALQRRLDKYQKKTDLPKITLHGFRHSHATMLLELTNDLKAVSERLGHESVEVTANVYCHVTSEQNKRLVNAIDSAIDEINYSKLECIKRNITKLIENALNDTDLKVKDKMELMNIYTIINE